MNAVTVVLSFVSEVAIPSQQVVGMDISGNGLVALADFALWEVADVVDILDKALVLLLEFLVGFREDQEASQVVDASLELFYQLVFEYCLLVEVSSTFGLNVDDSVVECFRLEAKLAQDPNVSQEVVDQSYGFRVARSCHWRAQHRQGTPNSIAIPPICRTLPLERPSKIHIQLQRCRRCLPLVCLILPEVSKKLPNLLDNLKHLTQHDNPGRILPHHTQRCMILLQLLPVTTKNTRTNMQKVF